MIHALFRFKTPKKVKVQQVMQGAAQKTDKLVACKLVHIPIPSLSANAALSGAVDAVHVK